MEHEGRVWPVQIFATDLNGVGIERARMGLYPKSISEHVAPERLRRYFYEVDGKYRVAKSIRDMCIFAKHNIAADPRVRVKRRARWRTGTAQFVEPDAVTLARFGVYARSGLRVLAEDPKILRIDFDEVR